MGLIDYKTVFFLLDLDVSMIIDYPSSSSMGHGEIPYRPMDGGLKYVFFFNHLPSGKRLHNYGQMDKSTIF